MDNNQQALLWGDDKHAIKTLEKYPFVCREAAIKYGSDNLTLEQLIGLLIECPKETAESLAQMGIRGLIDASDKELLTYKGIGPKGLLRIRGIFSLYKKILGETQSEQPIITSPKDVSKLLMPEMRYLDREQFKVILLNTRNRVVKIVTISIGGLNHSPAHPREIFKDAIRESASSIILVHNHPSGEVKPSKADEEVTKVMVEAGKVIGINVLDHIIIGDGRISSFKEMQLI